MYDAVDFCQAVDLQPNDIGCPWGNFALSFFYGQKAYIVCELFGDVVRVSDIHDYTHLDQRTVFTVSRVDAPARVKAIWKAAVQNQ